ncbi:MAG TPA: cytochrome b5 domain-containing protein, partial [Thermomicrobiales bacterium]|nr:cytochrome b5 domain-containing protein [Thermomicrobiales bacterium]
RLYSISSAMEPDAPEGASTLDLTVARLRYETKDTPLSKAAWRNGAASSFISRAATGQPGSRTERGIPIQIVPAARFHLPSDPARPIVMFAAGSGIAPFRGFLEERARQAGGGENWLFFGTRTPEQLYYLGLLEQMLAGGRLQARVAFSAADVNARYVNSDNGGAFVFEPGVRGRLNVLMEQEENAQALWELLRGEEEGGRGAHIYVCGRSGFAVAVERSLQTIIARFSDRTNDRARAARETFYHLVADGRYKQDVFTTYSGVHEEGQRPIDISDVVLRNNDRRGYWFIVSGKVYDMSSFMFRHPGGHRLIIENAGTDATHAYRAVAHHRNTEVDAMLGMYEIGYIRRLRFKEAWGVAIGPHGLRYVSVADAFREWARFLYLIVDMENALTNDFSTLRRSATAGESPDEMTPMKVQMITDTHRRFVLNQLATVVGEGMRELWALATGLCAPHEHARQLGEALDVLAGSPDARAVYECAAIMDGLIERLLDRQHDNDDADDTLERLRLLGNLVYREDRRFLAEIKLALRDGLQVFEAFEDRTASDGGPRLLASIGRVPSVVAEFHARLATGMRAITGEPPASESSGALRGDEPDSPAGKHPAPLLGHGAAVAEDAPGASLAEHRGLA